VEQTFKITNAMNTNDIKLYFFNAFSLGMTFTAVENGLKLFLLLASIVYTLQKIYQTHRTKKNDKKL